MEFKVLWISKNARIIPAQKQFLSEMASKINAELVLQECVEAPLNPRWIYANRILIFRPHVVVAVAPLDVIYPLVQKSQGRGYEVWKPEMLLMHAGCGGTRCPNYDARKDVLTRVAQPDGAATLLHYRFYRFVRIKDIHIDSEEIAI